MNVIVNGEHYPLTDGARVEDVLVLLGRDRQGHGMAVAINGQIVPRSEWPDRVLSPDDRVEVLHAIGGG